MGITAKRFFCDPNISNRVDWRLKFINLKTGDYRKNIIGDEDLLRIWIPNLIFDNTVHDHQVIKYHL